MYDIGILDVKLSNFVTFLTPELPKLICCTLLVIDDLLNLENSINNIYNFICIKKTKTFKCEELIYFDFLLIDSQIVITIFLKLYLIL